MLLRLISIYLDTFGRFSFDKSTGWQTEQDTVDKTDNTEEKGVFCAHCDTRLAGRDAAFVYAGAQHHRFINPAGIEFEIVLYRDASVIAHGPATEEHTWFHGYAWQVVLCSQCHVHLGWRYRRSDSPVFYGLIATHIIER